MTTARKRDRQERALVLVRNRQEWWSDLAEEGVQEHTMLNDHNKVVSPHQKFIQATAEVTNLVAKGIKA